MKTIIVHPRDKSTDFLSVIYKDIPNYTLINYSISKSELAVLLKAYDRAIFLGHGSEYGLFNMSDGDYIVNTEHAEILKDMKDNIYIWCNADVFVKMHDLQGFYTGMIVSDTDEAQLYNIKATLEEVDISNVNFAKSVQASVHLSPKLMVENVKVHYDNEFNNFNSVINFNKNNIYYV